MHKRAYSGMFNCCILNSFCTLVYFRELLLVCVAMCSRTIAVLHSVCFLLCSCFEILFCTALVYKLQHNDMDDLERLLKKQEEEDKKDPQKAHATRRFIVVEGLYEYSGEIVPLDKLVRQSFFFSYSCVIFSDFEVFYAVHGFHCQQLSTFLVCVYVCIHYNTYTHTHSLTPPCSHAHLYPLRLNSSTSTKCGSSWRRACHSVCSV